MLSAVVYCSLLLFCLQCYLQLFVAIGLNALLGVRCLLFVGVCYLVTAGRMYVVVLLFVACCMLYVIGCLLFVVCCLRFAAGCLLMSAGSHVLLFVAVCGLLLVVACCLLFVVC